MLMHKFGHLCFCDFGGWQWCGKKTCPRKLMLHGLFIGWIHLPCFLQSYILHIHALAKFGHGDTSNLCPHFPLVWFVRIRQKRDMLSDVVFFLAFLYAFWHMGIHRPMLAFDKGLFTSVSIFSFFFFFYGIFIHLCNARDEQFHNHMHRS